VENWQNILKQFESIALNQMDEVALMDRIDTKFAFNVDDLDHILQSMIDEYYVLQIEENRISGYRSLYFDDEKFRFYNDHHNTKDRRFKVRYRSYISSNVHFLEIKEKRKGRTRKKRIPVKGIKNNLNVEEVDFLKQFIDTPENLQAKLWNEYNRITFVSKNKKERLTLDLNLKFEWEGMNRSFNQLVIAELKQKKLDRSSPFFKIMKSMEIRPYRLSKYCLGILKMHKNSRLKYNRFKKKIIKLKKITHDT
jgi:hypothetical protein